MTHLIERFTVTVEVNHDKTPETSKAYGGDYDPKKAIERSEIVWAFDQARMDFVGNGSGAHHFDNGVTMRWESTGLEEVPEESGGDN